MRAVSIVVAIALLATYLPVPAVAETSRVTIVSPSAGETVNGQSVEVSAAYNTDSSAKVTRVEVLVDGVSCGIKHFANPATRGIASFLIDTTRIGNGGHNVVIKIFSGDKLVGSTSGRYKIGNRPLDVVAPDLRFAGIKKGDVVSGVAYIEIAAKDNGRDNPLVSVFVDKNLKLIKNVPPYVYEWDTSRCENGKHTLEACAYDSSGNKSEAETIEVLVQNGGKSSIAASPAPEKVAVANADIQPIIPMSREAKATAARSVDKVSSISSKANFPVAKPESPVMTARAQVTLHEESSKSSVSRVTIPPAASAEIAKPAVVAVAPDAKVKLPVTSVPSVDVSKIQTDNRPAADPAKTKPGVAESGRISSNVIASLPSDMEAAPASTMSPSVAPPAATTANQRVGMDQSTLESVSTESEFGQRLARPQTATTVSATKPVMMAAAPKPVIPAVQPSLEPRKVKLTLETKKINGVVVSELRYVIESASGTIVAWDPRLKTVLAVIGGRKFKLRINDRTAIINGKAMRLASAPYVNSKGRTVVDVKLLKSLVGTRLDRDEKSGKWVLVSR
ncbi:MAG: Ig-like domain-containing protein [Armatimonadota bacterium]